MTKKTTLYETNLKMGAKVIDFAGWMMPVQYSSIIEEHKNVRNNVGVFDVSHMGEVFVTGKDAMIFLNKLVPQDISKLQDLKAVYCQLTNDKGGIIDDLIIYKLKDNHYLLIVNASRIDEDMNWINKNKSNFDCETDNQSDNYSLVAIQGPKAKLLIEKMGYKDLPEYFYIKPEKYKGNDIYLSRTGYTGEDGFEIMIKNEQVETLWNDLFEQGKEFDIKPIGLGARDTLRLEAALHLYGNDLDENTTPIEAGLSWSVPKNKEQDYNGKETIFNQLKNGYNKKLIGIKMASRVIPRHENEIFYNGEKVGVVTSGSFSPTLNEPVALGYVKNTKEICLDSVVQVMIREKLYDAKVVKRPFVNKNTAK